MIKLYHYTNTAKLKKISPRYFGGNYYTKNDVNACKVKRSFFYSTQTVKSLLKSAPYCYTVNVNEKRLYDIQADKKSLYNGNLTTFLTAIKNLSYIGIKYSYNDYNIVSLFYSVTVT